MIIFFVTDFCCPFLCIQAISSQLLNSYSCSNDFADFQLFVNYLFQQASYFLAIIRSFAFKWLSECVLSTYLQKRHINSLINYNYSLTFLCFIYCIFFSIIKISVVTQTALFVGSSSDPWLANTERQWIAPVQTRYGMYYKYYYYEYSIYNVECFPSYLHTTCGITHWMRFYAPQEFLSI